MLDLLVPSWSDAAGRHGFRPPDAAKGPSPALRAQQMDGTPPAEQVPPAQPPQELLRAQQLGLGLGVQPLNEPLRAQQVHGVAVIEVSPGAQSPVGEADALVSATVGLAVGIATADCVPILLDAPGVVAAVHAGWRGSLEGVVLATLRHLATRHGVAPAEVRVALGPSIDGCCFEIEREIAARFAVRWGSRVWRLWRERPAGKGTLDLRGFNALVLLEAGVGENAIERVGPCTFCGPGPWASYRREGPDCGRQLAWVAPGPRP